MFLAAPCTRHFPTYATVLVRAHRTPRSTTRHEIPHRAHRTEIWCFGARGARGARGAVFRDARGARGVCGAVFRDTGTNQCSTYTLFVDTYTRTTNRTRTLYKSASAHVPRATTHRWPRRFCPLASHFEYMQTDRQTLDRRLYAFH